MAYCAAVAEPAAATGELTAGAAAWLKVENGQPSAQMGPLAESSDVSQRLDRWRLKAERERPPGCGELLSLRI